VSEILERVERALSELFAAGPERSLVSEYMAEAAWDDELVAFVRSHHVQLFEAAHAQQLKTFPRQPAEALVRANNQTLSLIFRMAFEAGRIDERNSVSDLHFLVQLEGEEG
jgi:hypothetical protein